MVRWWYEITGFLLRRRDTYVIRRRLRTYVGTTTSRG
jgi:hypothetical protein